MRKYTIELIGWLHDGYRYVGYTHDLPSNLCLWDYFTDSTPVSAHCIDEAIEAWHDRYKGGFYKWEPEWDVIEVKG